MTDEDKEKTGNTPATEEEQHEPDSEPKPDEDEQDEDEYDQIIAGLLATVDALDARVAELERKLEQHGIAYEHVARRTEDGNADGAESTPEERHFYFKRIGGKH